MDVESKGDGRVSEWQFCGQICPLTSRENSNRSTISNRTNLKMNARWQCQNQTGASAQEETDISKAGKSCVTFALHFFVGLAKSISCTAPCNRKDITENCSA
jgi:hypothetical protein